MVKPKEQPLKDQAKDQCGMCSKMVTKSDKGVQCDNCFNWYHTECHLISAERYEYLIQNKKKKWFCSWCVNEILLNKIVNLEKACASLPNIKQELDKMKEQNVELHQKVDSLEKEVGRLKTSVERQEQYSLKNNLILEGVPERKNENPTDIIYKIANKLGVKCRGVIAAHRLKEIPALKAKGIPKDIIIKFLSYDTKSHILQAFKKLKKSLHSSEIVPDTNSNIYLKDHLTPFRSYLYRKAKAMVKDNHIKFAWIKAGNVLVKVEEKSQAKTIFSLNELIELIKAKEKETAESSNGNENTENKGSQIKEAPGEKTPTEGKSQPDSQPSASIS